MPRTLVLLNEHKEQITNSNPGSHPELHNLFPQDGPMPDSLEWNGRQFKFMDQPTHETDHPGHELYRYISSVSDCPSTNGDWLGGSF